jgi:hypothetical protein
MTLIFILMFGLFCITCAATITQLSERNGADPILVLSVIGLGGAAAIIGSNIF